MTGLNLGPILTVGLVVAIGLVLLVGLILAPGSPGRARGPRAQFWLILLLGAVIATVAALGIGGEAVPRGQSGRPTPVHPDRVDKAAGQLVTR